MNDFKPILESLLFVAEEPLTVDKLNSVLELSDKSEIRTALEELREILDNREGGFHLREVAGGWQLRTRPEYHEWIKRMLQPSPQRLSRAALETLAIVAYKQPVIRADIEFIRGVDSGGVLRQLMERKLIRVLGRKEIPGRPLIYATTKLFLELFDLKDLKDLPSPKEIEELSGSSSHETDTQATSDTTENETDIDTEITETTAITTPESNEAMSEEDAEITPAEEETVSVSLENDAETGTADTVGNDTLSIPPDASSDSESAQTEPDPEKDSEKSTEFVENDDSDIDTETMETTAITTPESNEALSEEDAEITLAEVETDSLENDAETGTGDTVEKDALSIPPDTVSNPESEHDDSDTPDASVQRAYVVTASDDSRANPKEKEINPTGKGALSISLTSSTSSTESSVLTREQTESDPQKDSEQNPEFVENDDSDHPDSSAHSKKDSNNLLS